MTKSKKCYIYTRVSTSMQVEGYSLESQKEKLKNFADYQEMIVVGDYSDEGKSGKNVENRPDFMRMLSDIENGKDNVDFVLVYVTRGRFARHTVKKILSSTI